MKIHGGLAFKSLPFGAIETIPPPTRVAIKVASKSTIAVKTGDTVLKGQPLTSVDTSAVMSHASVSGTITSINNCTISIQSDGQDTPYPSSPQTDIRANEILTLCHQNGLVGLGGAAYPVAKKLSSASQHNTVNTLLINAAECDPAIYCDEALIQERPEAIVKGIKLALTASGASNCIVGIEENKILAIAELKKHLPDNIKLVVVPAIYPSGAENTLFTLCTGKTGGLRYNQSLCFNIATCYSIYKAVELAEPLLSRIVTVVTSDNIRNVELRIGTPVTDVLKDLNTVGNQTITCGGQMMGRRVSAEHSIDKQTNSLLFNTAENKTAVACIRCGACADVCPEHLLPQQLFWHTDPHNSSALSNLKLDACIECACCDVVCPSNIQLTQHFIGAKNTIELQRVEQKKAELAKERYEKRLARLESQSLRERKKLDRKSDKLINSKDKEQLKKEMIAKALQKSMRKKKSTSGNSADDSPPQ